MLNKGFVFSIIVFAIFSVAHSQRFYIQTRLDTTVHYMETRLVESTKNGMILLIEKYIQPSEDDFLKSKATSSFVDSAMFPISKSEDVKDFDPKKLDWIFIFISGSKIDNGSSFGTLTFQPPKTQPVDIRLFTNKTETIAKAFAFRNPNWGPERPAMDVPVGWRDKFRLTHLVDSATRTPITRTEIGDSQLPATMVIRIDSGSEELWYRLHEKQERLDCIPGLIVEVGLKLKWILKTTINRIDYYAEVCKFHNKERDTPREYLVIESDGSQAKKLKLYRCDSSIDAGILDVKVTDVNLANKMTNAAISLQINVSPTWKTLEPQRYSWLPISITTARPLPGDGSMELGYEKPKEFHIGICVSRPGDKGRNSTILLGIALVQEKLAENDSLSNWSGRIIIRWNRPKKFTETTKIDNIKAEQGPDQLFVRERNNSKQEKWRRVFGIDHYVGLGSMVIGQLMSDQVTFWIRTNIKGKSSEIKFPATIDELKREITVHDTKKFRGLPKELKSELKNYLKNSKNEFGIIRDSIKNPKRISVVIDKKSISGEEPVLFTYTNK